MSYIFNGCSKSFLRRFRLQLVKVSTTSNITATAANTPVKIASIITSVSAMEVDKNFCYILIHVRVVNRTRIQCLNCDKNNQTKNHQLYRSCLLVGFCTLVSI